MISPYEKSSGLMKIVEDKVKNIEKLDKNDIKNRILKNNLVLQTMKQEKFFLEKENEQVYTAFNKSKSQINL